MILKDNLPLLISFSGGRTSAFMAKFLIESSDLDHKEKVVVYANTGKEFEHTLEFINECDKRWNLNVVWLDSVVNHEKGKGTDFKVVDFESASRNGEPFEEVIKKYGIPNKQFPHCTRELKQVPIKKYMKSLGYSEWHTAVGIRADEPHRINRGSDTNFINPFFPLADMIKVDERFIREWWEKQDFDLELKDYQSNCDLCWKKSKRKRLTLLEEDERIGDWWKRMEDLYGENYRFDQREGVNVIDLIQESKRPFRKAIDKHDLRKSQTNLFDPIMDTEYDCFCKNS